MGPAAVLLGAEVPFILRDHRHLWNANEAFFFFLSITFHF